MIVMLEHPHMENQEKAPLHFQKQQNPMLLKEQGIVVNVRELANVIDNQSNARQV